MAAFAISLLGGTAMAQLPKEAPKTSGPGSDGSKLPRRRAVRPAEGQHARAGRFTAAANGGERICRPVKLKVPAGFKVEPYATGMADARSLRGQPVRDGIRGQPVAGQGLCGNVPGTNGGKPTVKVIAKGLYRPNGVAFHDGSLYVAELNRITRYDNIEANLDNPPKPVLDL